MDEILSLADSSFKYILLAFNFITLLVIYLHKRRNKPPKQHHILLLTAHPDDESMFFRPTIRSIANEYYLHLLCLSGANTPRESQLKEAANHLGFHKVVCIDDNKLTDGMKEKWCQQTIRQHFLTYVRENNIKAVFTFDGRGISSHPNHIAIYNGIKDLEVLEGDQTIKVYYLESVCLMRKYLGWTECLWTLLRTYSWHNWMWIDGYRCMSMHKSQFVWYRRLWVFFSRYNYINTYERKLLRI